MSEGRWSNFLASLETEGGKLFVTVLLLVFLVGVALACIETNHPLQEAGREMMVGAGSSLLTIAYGHLKTKGG